MGVSKNTDTPKWMLMDISWVYPPPRIPVANEGLGWDSLLKMVHNPGGDWNPGWGVDLRYTMHFVGNKWVETYMTLTLFVFVFNACNTKPTRKPPALSSNHMF